MAINLRKDETLKRISGSPKVRSKLFLNDISAADKNELSRWMKDCTKGNAFVVVMLE